MNTNSQNLPLYASLERYIANTRFGELPLRVIVHDGRAVAIAGETTKKRIYKKSDGAVKALEELVLDVKDVCSTKETSTITAVLTMREGKVIAMTATREVQMQLSGSEVAQL